MSCAPAAVAAPCDPMSRLTTRAKRQQHRTIACLRLVAPVSIANAPPAAACTSLSDRTAPQTSCAPYLQALGMTIPKMIKLTGPWQSFSTISCAIGRTAAMQRNAGRWRPVRNLKMQSEQGLPRGGPFELEYLFMLMSATLAALSGGAAKARSRSRHLLLCTLRRTGTPML